MVQRKRASFLQLLCLVCLLVVAPACAQAQSRPSAPASAAPSTAVSVSLLTFDGPISPAYADHVERGMYESRSHRNQKLIEGIKDVMKEAQCS